MGAAIVLCSDIPNAAPAAAALVQDRKSRLRIAIAPVLWKDYPTVLEAGIAAASAAEAEARIQDSLMQVEKVRQDSLALVEQAMADSLRMKAEADSIAAAKKKSTPKPAPKKSTEQKKIEQQIKEVKDATRGRG